MIGRVETFRSGGVGLVVDYLHESAASIYRRRRRNRTIVTMTCVTLLLFGTVVYAASYVQGWVGASAPKVVANASCNGATSNQPLKPIGVTLNVYNATVRTGLAASVAGSLQKQGFKIATIDNDPLGKTILGVGEIRHGPSGLEGAILAAQRLPGATIVQDSRMDASVDLVLGKTFRALTAPANVAPSTKAKPISHC
jgi:hypothetical protein